MDLQEQLEIGKRAEDFLKHITDNPYFAGLVERLRLEYARQILDLAALDREEFSRLRWQMDAVGGIIEAVRGDIYLGAEAFKRLNGETEPSGGLL